MEEIVNKLESTGCEVNIRNCGGVYDTIIRVKYGFDSNDLGWVYLKDGKILLIHIKDDNFPDIDSFVSKLKELKKLKYPAKRRVFCYIAIIHKTHLDF